MYVENNSNCLKFTGTKKSSTSRYQDYNSNFFSRGTFSSFWNIVLFYLIVLKYNTPCIHFYIWLSWNIIHHTYILLYLIILKYTIHILLFLIILKYYSVYLLLPTRKPKLSGSRVWRRRYIQLIPQPGGKFSGRKIQF